jgi:hypothetical protein
MNEAARLRAEAGKCREFARQARDAMTKANLHALADDYEAEAAKLDGGRDEAPVPNPQPE